VLALSFLRVLSSRGDQVCAGAHSSREESKAHSKHAEGGASERVSATKCLFGGMHPRFDPTTRVQRRLEMCSPC